MITRRVLLVLLVAVCGSLASCTQGNEPTNENRPASGLLINGVRVVRKAIQSDLTIPGITVAANQVTVRAPSSGRISNLTLLPGDRVRRGQAVATVTTREELAAHTGAELARRLDPADSKAMEQAVGRYANGPGITVTAAENGTVAKRDASDGQFVNEFDPIIELIDPNSIYVEAQIALRFLARIQPKQAATVTSQALANPMVGHVAAILPGASPASQTFPIRIVLDQNNALLQAGIAVDVTLTIASRSGVLVIPAASIFINPETQSYYVFTIGADNKCHRRTIEVGIRDASNVEVLAGLAEGATVITSGGYALADGLPVRLASPGGQ